MGTTIWADKDGKPIEPRCPCGALVDRPKCFWELGSECDRHMLRLYWKKVVDVWKEDTFYGYQSSHVG